MNTRNRFWGVYTSLILGVLSLAAGTKDNPSLFNAGAIIILTSMIYRSAKNRNIGVKNNSITSICLELLVFIVILYLSFAPRNLKELIITDPVPNFIIPVWCIVAFAYIFVRRKKSIATS